MGAELPRASESVPPSTSVSEAAVARACLHYLMMRDDIRVWRANAGAVEQAGGRLIRFGVRGQADQTGIITVDGVGVRLEIEFKSSTGKQSDPQQTFQNLIVAMGGIYVLASSVETLTVGLDAGTAAVRSRTGADRPLTFGEQAFLAGKPR